MLIAESHDDTGDETIICANHVESFMMLEITVLQLNKKPNGTPTFLEVRKFYL